VNREKLPLEESQKLWDRLGSSDPLEAILAEGHGGKWDVSTFFTTGKTEVEEVFNYLARRGVAVQRNDALDFGCGVGRLTQAFAAKFERVIGVDISPSMLETAREINRSFENIRYLTNSRPDLSILRDEVVDFVYSNIALQHVDPRFSSRYIQEFVRVLRPEGIALFQLPAETFLHRVLPVALLKGVRKAMFGSPDPGLFGMAPEAVRSIVDLSGAQVIDIREIVGGPTWGAPLTTSPRDRRFRGYPISLNSFVSYRYLCRRLNSGGGYLSERGINDPPQLEKDARG
jgi:SAM-dependent methyltransferase